MPAISVPRTIEPPRFAVGRRSLSLPGAGDGSPLTVECWHPATTSDSGNLPLTEYEVLPGVAFRSALAVSGATCAPGPWPVVLLSHGRTGTSIAYSSLCEALAARGSIVLAPLHVGDSLGDWLAGTQVDDRTNEANRVADAAGVVAALASGASIPADLASAADLRRLVLAGHSYGAYTAFAATAARLLTVEPSAVMAFQPYTRMMSDELLGSLSVPTLLVASDSDRTTPPSSDVDRPWALVAGRPAWRLDLRAAGHQAVSDTALYAELSGEMPSLPELVRAYLAASVDPQPAGRTWRDVLRAQVEVSWSFALSVWAGDDIGVEVPPALGRLERRGR